MSTFTWSLSVEPAQTPEYWLLYVDGFAHCALMRVPYTGPGKYSVDLSALDVPLPLGVHSLSVGLVGQGVAGPQSPGAQINVVPPPAPVSLPGVGVVTGDQAPVWPTADSSAIQ